MENITISVIALIFALAALILIIVVFFRHTMKERLEVAAPTPTPQPETHPSNGQAIPATKDAVPAEQSTSDQVQEQTPKDNAQSQPPKFEQNGSLSDHLSTQEKIHDLLTKSYREEGYQTAVRLGSSDYKWTRMEELVGRVLLLVDQEISRYKELKESTEKLARSRRAEGYISLAENLDQQAELYQREFERTMELKKKGVAIIQQIREHKIDPDMPHEPNQADYNPFYVMLTSFENGFQEGIVEISRAQSIA
ncbi:hypothetical protein [Thermoflavifilum thermophilum]|uniref:Uncharacterized protein n=1 Tax=Thermoflavifilum thermophilum TaxID=1393122 RepID=A0A1I7ND88_9BACT|nr:hypothetical protein [Thermoflavifilum thermophilum]SFV32599.1 hypothetical protein SAMN05660895_1396 [Thermoflavifilum thermophilum]